MLQAEPYALHTIVLRDLYDFLGVINFTQKAKAMGTTEFCSTDLPPLIPEMQPQTKSAGNRGVMTMRIHFYRTLAVAVLPFALGAILLCAPAQRCDAQAQAQPGAPTTLAALHEPAASGPGGDGGTTSKAAPSAPAPSPDPEISPAVAKQLATMQAEIEELKALLKSNAESAPTSARATAPAASVAQPTPAITIANPVVPVAQAADTTTKPEKPEATVPFAYADWTWLNGNPRNKDAVWDSKFFTPEIRMDIHYIQDLNHPRDDTMGGSTEIFRSNEFQVEQISFGGNFHWQNVNARILTMNGMFGITTPRNDASAGRGQWDLRGRVQIRFRGQRRLSLGRKPRAQC